MTEQVEQNEFDVVEENIIEPQLGQREPKVAYNYHRQTREFLGQSDVEPDPMDVENWLLPADATYLAPPKLKANQAAVWTGDKWQKVPDHRGETWFDENAQEVVILNFGNPATSGLLKEKPVLPEPEPIYPALTARQLRLALLKIGKLNDVPSLIAKLPSPDKEEAEIEWQYANSFSRDHKLIALLAPAVGLSDADVNAIWLKAAEL